MEKSRQSENIKGFEFMYVKELCWKCFRGTGEGKFAGKREEFEEIWAEKRIWCPVGKFGKKKFKPLKRFNGMGKVPVIGSNLRFKDKVPEGCPYYLEQVISRRCKKVFEQS